MKAIMYHYVREFDPDFPNFRFLDIKNFRRQLDYFATEYGFVTRAEWEQALRTGDPSGCDNKVILTFDDAMSCHYNYVFPELCARNLWGIFYVPAQPYLAGEMLAVHRVH
jgi:peptidoglycan/xylan/chitin deacetylase (PgdA/CDA1 family)